jgi:hypothetical protein
MILYDPGEIYIVSPLVAFSNAFQRSFSLNTLIAFVDMNLRGTKKKKVRYKRDVKKEITLYK